MKGFQAIRASVWVVVLALCCAAGAAWGQIGTGSIAGSVTDQTGAAIPNASITATEAASGTRYTSNSSSSGYYVFPSVRPGTYTLAVAAPGFSTSSTTGVIVDISSRAGQDIKLAVGGASATVEVNASGPSLETETSDIGTVITPEQVQDLPQVGGGGTRSLAFLTFLAPGAVGPGTNGGTGFTKIGGGQTEGSDFLLDGISTFRSENGTGDFDSTAPSLDAISEFRVETFSLPAYIGRTTGGAANYKTASGINSYHGRIYDYYTNTILDANNWFTKGHAIQAGTTQDASQLYRRGKDIHNDYGVTLGGPVQVPYLYNGKDKTFFFFSFEQVPNHFSNNSSATLPTLAERTGDFSALLTTTPILGANNVPIVNPCTGQNVLIGQIFDPSTTRTVNGVRCRTPFLNNQVPVGQSKVATNVLALLPQPNVNLPGGVNYSIHTTFSSTTDIYSLRLDQNFGTRNHIFAFGSARENFSPSSPNFVGASAAINSGGNQQDFYSKYLRAGWDFTITPHLVNSFTVGGNRINSFNVSPAAENGINYDAQLGIGNTPNAGTTFPIFNFGSPGFTSIGGNNFDDNVDNAILGNEALTWQKGQHSVQVGAVYRWQQFSYINNGTAAGTYNFSTYQTSAFENNATVEQQTGFGFASFLLGQTASSGRTLQLHFPQWIQHYYAGYVQDDWKARKNLTLNLGFRYSVDTPRHEARGFISSFDPTVPNPAANGRLGGVRFGGVGAGRDGNNNEQFANTFYKDFEPRVGFAYSPGWLNASTVLRGSYGIIYGPLSYSDFGQGLSRGFTNSSPAVNNPAFLPSGFLDNGPPSISLTPNTAPDQNLGGGLDYVLPTDGKPGMVQNWALEVQTQLAPDLIFSLGYLGQHSTRLRSLVYYPNTIDPKYFALGDILGQSANSPAAQAAGITIPYANFFSTTNGTVGQSLRPFPQYGYLNNDSYLQDRGQSSYHAMEVKMERRFRNGLNLLASYTWSKTLTDADAIQPFFATTLGQGGTQNPFNLKGDKAVSTQDVPTNFVISYLYDLPVGKGKKFLGNSNKLVNAAIGGYRIGGIQRYLSGQPISFFGATQIPQGYDGGIRFSRAKGVDIENPIAHSGHYNPLAFVPNPGNNTNIQNQTGFFNRLAFIDQNDPAHRGTGAFRFGDLPRNTAEVRTPAYFDEALNISKRFAVRESINAEVRFELFNAFNRHVFGKPDSGVNDFNFGQITGLNDGPRHGQFVLRINY